MAKQENRLEVAVFDLNGTFYHKSSMEEFYKFICARKKQKVLVLFELLYYKLLKKMHVIGKTEFKENFFNYLDHIPPKEVEALGREFWQREFPGEFNQELMDCIHNLRARGVRVVCITGALELYVQPLFELYEIDGVSGTRVKYVDGTYKVQGVACKGKEKLQRIDHLFNGQPYHIVEAYSDSKEEILDEADKAYLVKDGKITPYQA